MAATTLLVTDDPLLAETVRRVAAVAARDLEVVPDPQDARASWMRVEDVVVGDDAANLDEVLASIEAALRGTVSEARGEGAVADRLVIARLNLACPPRLREACSCRENELTDEARAIARGLGGIRVERVVVAGTSRPIDHDPPGEPR